MPQTIHRSTHQMHMIRIGHHNSRMVTCFKLNAELVFLINVYKYSLSGSAIWPCNTHFHAALSYAACWYTSYSMSSESKLVAFPVLYQWIGSVKNTTSKLDVAETPCLLNSLYVFRSHSKLNSSLYQRYKLNAVNQSIDFQVSVWRFLLLPRGSWLCQQWYAEFISKSATCLF